MNRLIAAVVLLLAVALGAYTQSNRQTGNRSSRATYTKAQADRGKAVYAQSCSTCHLDSLKGKCSEDLSSLTYICATAGSAPPLVGAPFMQRFYSVNDLFQRVKWTMPADKINSLSVPDNLAVVAYLMQQNGVPAGSEELKYDQNALKETLLATNASSAGRPDSNATNHLNSYGISESYYTAAQAERGKGYFYGSCATCHTADGKTEAGPMPISTGLGWRRGEVNMMWQFAGDYFLGQDSGIPARPQRWDTVADLYIKTSMTQPASAVGAMSKQAYVDMVAYILKQNGFPAGKEELTDNIRQMRNMTMNKGFERVFNGKDLTGWGFVVGANCPPQPEGCGESSPGTTFTVKDGVIVNSGTPHGYMYPRDKKYLNFTLRAEHRLIPYEGMESDQDLYTNTGYFLFITRHDVWPPTLEVQGKNNFEMTLAMGRQETKNTIDDAARVRARKPAGQWNAIQIVSKDNQIWTYLNGAQVTHISSHPFKEGYLGFQAESGTVEWRNIRIKAE